MPFNVPGIGYAGLGQQTAAGQLTFRKAMGGRSTGFKRRRLSNRAGGPRRGRYSAMKTRGPRGAKRRRRSFRETEGRARVPSGRLGARSDRHLKTRGRSKLKRLVKGSAAARRHMARLRRMRKR